MAENTVLEVQELTREFTRRGKPFAAVDHVDFRLGQGEFVAIVGRSGNGKSTLLNLITGLLKPTSGSIDLDGNDVTRLNDKQMSVVRNRIVRIRHAKPDIAAESHGTRQCDSSFRAVQRQNGASRC